MSSNRRPSLFRRHSGRRRTLRGRLIAVVLGLLAMICLLVGAVTVFALHSYLLDQVDHQLAGAGARAAGPHDHDGPGPRDDGDGDHGDGDHGPPAGDARGLPPGTITATISSAGVDADKQSDQAESQPLDARWDGSLRSVPVDGHPHTLALGGLGDYRLLASENDGTTVVTGLPLQDEQDTLVSVAVVLAGISLAGLALTGFGGALVIRRELRPLERVAATASSVSELSLHRGEVDMPMRVPAADTDPATEVGRVGAALNRLLDHVGEALTVRHASESRVRQFVADASHELRTPLASIRGYAELTRKHGDAVPPDVLYAMGRVEAESERMTTLVEDLLLLARLDEGRPLVREPVDLSRLVVDAVSDAQVTGTGHRWLLDMPGVEVTVSGDAIALHQVVTNLLANARTHTPDGTTVRTTVSTVDSAVRLVVADDGPGIPPDVLPEVFERFARGDASRARRAGSTGLGLAIVHAVVAAHGGTVEVASEPGRTEFTVTLPR